MIAQVTTGFTAAGDLVIPGQSCSVITIQNNGTGTWRLSFDGGSGRKGHPNGRAGTDPTASTGYILAPGMQWPQTLAQYKTWGPRVITAIFVAASGTQLLDICTDDVDSTAPAHA